MMALSYQVWVADHQWGPVVVGLDAALAMSNRAARLGTPSLVITKAKR
jgi:hypothetical protein